MTQQKQVRALLRPYWFNGFGVSIHNSIRGNDTFPLEMFNSQLYTKRILLSSLSCESSIVFLSPDTHLSVNIRFDVCPTCRQAGGKASQLHRPLRIQELSVSLRMIQGSSRQNISAAHRKEPLCYVLVPIRDRPCWRGSAGRCPSAGGCGTPGLRCGPGASSSG